MSAEHQLRELARQTLEVLTIQQEYFKARRRNVDATELLSKSKASERELQNRCQEILNRPEPGLFDGSEAK